MIHSYIQAVNEDFFSGRGEVTETPYSAIDVATPMFLLDCNLGGEYGDPHVKMATFVQCSSRGCELHIYARNSGFTEDKNEVAVDMNAASIEAAFRNVITWLLDQGLARVILYIDEIERDTKIEIDGIYTPIIELKEKAVYRVGGYEDPEVYDGSYKSLWSFRSRYRYTRVNPTANEVQTSSDE